MMGVDWIAGLPTTAAGFDTMQNHVDLLSGKAHAVPTRRGSTSDAAAIIRGPGLPAATASLTSWWWTATPITAQ
jgi:hypothetical protein